MDERDRAEWQRLEHALVTGPGRRMVADAVAGRGLSRADEWQAASIERQMLALTDGHA
jgi:hypothetical protein